MNLRRFRLVLCIMAAMLALPGMVSAGVITLTLSKIYNGVAPIGPAPWSRATFTDGVDPTDPTKPVVWLTMENLATGSAGQFIDQWTFNVSNETVLSSLSFTYEALLSSDANAATTIDYLVANGENASGGGNAGKGFDIAFNFATAGNDDNRFMAGETSVYAITGSGVTASLFNATTNKGLLTSAHIQGIPLGSGTTSGAATVPEPSSLVLWSLLGAAGMGITVVRRRRAKNG